MSRDCWRLTICALAMLASVDAYAQPISGLPTTTGTLVAKAQPDECFFAIGFNLPFTKPPCIFSQPKVNQAYVWAMTRAGSDIWFGTTANPQCITQGALGAVDPALLTAYKTPAWVCEFGSSPYSPWLLPALIGDFRPPQLLVWDSVNRVVIDVTPKAPVTATNPLGLDPVLQLTRGIRAAATIGDLVMLVGPSLIGGLNFFFYDATTHEYLGSDMLEGYDNIRQFTVYRGDLYAAVGQTLVGGAVLKWNGSKTAKPCFTCLSFENVGALDGLGAYITSHEGRLFVTTWPTGKQPSVASLYMSPRVPEGGLTADHASGWHTVWDANDYEPDPVIAPTYGGGALASFNGFLYWGTMNVPWHATAAFLTTHGAPTTEKEWLDAVFGTFRTAVVFRGRNFAAKKRKPRIDLLYGSPTLPAYVSSSATQSKTWQWVDNNMDPEKRMPRYGYAGFNNPYNNYIWAMEVWNNRLWIGTMDWSWPAMLGTDVLFNAAKMPVPIEILAFFATQTPGGDLFFIQDSKTPAVAESTSGIGNVTSYGIRNMVGADNSLFVGMANPNNLLTGPIGPRGGWELIELNGTDAELPNLLRRFTCAPRAVRRIKATCTVETSRPAPDAGLTVGVVVVANGAKVNVPLLVQIRGGETSASFRLEADPVSTSTTAVLVAGLNGGTHVASVELEPERKHRR
jgi:hypothetical protein